jgi:hypothetical protein
MVVLQNNIMLSGARFCHLISGSGSTTYMICNCCWDQATVNQLQVNHSKNITKNIPMLDQLQQHAYIQHIQHQKVTTPIGQSQHSFIHSTPSKMT